MVQEAGPKGEQKAAAAVWKALEVLDNAMPGKPPPNWIDGDDLGALALPRCGGSRFSASLRLRSSLVR